MGHSFSAIFLGSSMPACAISFLSFPEHMKAAWCPLHRPNGLSQFWIPKNAYFKKVTTLTWVGGDFSLSKSFKTCQTCQNPGQVDLYKLPSLLSKSLPKKNTSHATIPIFPHRSHPKKTPKVLRLGLLPLPPKHSPNLIFTGPNLQLFRWKWSTGEMFEKCTHRLED